MPSPCTFPILCSCLFTTFTPFSCQTIHWWKLIRVFIFTVKLCIFHFPHWQVTHHHGLMEKMSWKTHEFPSSTPLFPNSTLFPACQGISWQLDSIPIFVKVENMLAKLPGFGLKWTLLRFFLLLQRNVRCKCQFLTWVKVPNVSFAKLHYFSKNL